MVGLRQKREFGKGEGDPRIRDLFGGLLRDSQEALIAADRVIVIGFSFSKADDYLWCHLAAKQVGSPPTSLPPSTSPAPTGNVTYDKIASTASPARPGMRWIQWQEGPSLGNAATG